MAIRRKVLREGTRKKIEYFDYNLLAVLIFIICFGLIMLYSASAYRRRTMVMECICSEDRQWSRQEVLL